MSYSGLCRCVLDVKPAKFSAENCALLANFASMVVCEMRKDRLLAAQSKQSQMVTEERDVLIKAVNVLKYECPPCIRSFMFVLCCKF